MRIVAYFSSDKSCKFSIFRIKSFYTFLGLFLLILYAKQFLSTSSQIYCSKNILTSIYLDQTIKLINTSNICNIYIPPDFIF